MNEPVTKQSLTSHYPVDEPVTNHSPPQESDMCDAGGTLSLDQFKNFYKQIVNRPEVHVVLARLVFLLWIVTMVIIVYVIFLVRLT